MARVAQRVTDVLAREEVAGMARVLESADHWAYVTAAMPSAAPQVQEAQRLVVQLLAAAQLVTIGGAVVVCGVPDCALDDPHRNGATRLAHLLAAAGAGVAATSGVSVVRAPAEIDAETLRQLHRRFLRCLREAPAAVYVCRRVAHPLDRCLFDDAGPRSGLCGRVLAVARATDADVVRP